MAIIQPNNKFLAIGKNDPRLTNAFEKNQKTMLALYDTLPTNPAGNSFSFFQNAGTRTAPLLTNLTNGNRLPTDKMLAIQNISFAFFVNTAGVLSAPNTLNNVAEVGILGGSWSLIIDNGVVIEDQPMLNQLPQFNPSAKFMVAAYNTTTTTMFVAGDFVYDLPTPLILQSNKQFRLDLTTPTYTPTTNGALRCTMSGLGVLPNAGLI